MIAPTRPTFRSRLAIAFIVYRSARDNKKSVWWAIAIARAIAFPKRTP